MATERRVKNISKSRVTLTAAILFSPMRKEKCLLFIHNCPRLDRDQIEQYFEIIIVIAQQGKVVNGSTHLRVVLGRLVAQLVEENRRVLGQSFGEPHLFLRDMAPCHCGDDCRETGEKDLQRKRRSWYAASGVISHL